MPEIRYDEEFEGRQCRLYLTSWLGSLKKSSNFIKTTLMDVKKATSILSQRIDEVALEMKEQQSENVAASVSGKDKEEKEVELSVSSGRDEKQRGKGCRSAIPKIAEPANKKIHRDAHIIV